MATFLGNVLVARYPALVAARYGFAMAGKDGVGVIAAVARKRGYLLKGGEPDLEKAALTLLQDYRSGVLGRISLETPQTRKEMLAAQNTAGASDGWSTADR